MHCHKQLCKVCYLQKQRRQHNLLTLLRWCVLHRAVVVVISPQAKLSKSDAICNTGLLYNERSAQKEYQCTLSDPNIARIIGPVLPITCKTSGSNGAQTTSSSALAGRLALVYGGLYGYTLGLLIQTSLASRMLDWVDSEASTPATHVMHECIQQVPCNVGS